MELHLYIEAIECSCEENGITLAREQFGCIASDIKDSVEMYSDIESCRYASSPSFEARRIEELEKELERERNKSICSHCNGSGREIFYGGTLVFNSGCPRCKNGFIY